MKDSLHRMYLQLMLHGTPGQVRLMAHLHSCGGLRPLREELAAGQVPGMAPAQARQAARLLAAKQPDHPDLAAHLRWAEGEGNHLICYEEDAYPPRLREIACPPPLLFLRGNPAVLLQQQIAVVGSRRATGYGLRNTGTLVRELASAGMTVTSGLALGIDGKAHLAALDAGGDTLAVMATGADGCYPRSHQSLVERIVHQGAAITEFPLGTLPSAFNFPRRNRLISGLALGTLVVEAHLRSGSLITARLALDQNREVFAVPGPISMRSSEGCHELIRAGATLVASGRDILEELGLLPPAEKDAAAGKARGSGRGGDGGKGTRQSGASGTSDDAASAALTPAEQQVLAGIDPEGSVIERVMQDSAGSTRPFGELQSILLSLELKGRIESLGGRYFRL